MTINERIERIKPYFIGLNIAENIAYIVVKFPNTWRIPQSEFLRDEYKVSVGKVERGGNVYATEMVNGMDIVFDAIEYSISFNVEAEERATILKEKMKELSEIFAKEDVNKLRTLTFTFGKKTRNNKKTEEKEASQTTETVPVEENIVEETAAPVEVKTVKENDDNDLMSFAKDMIG